MNSFFLKQREFYSLITKIRNASIIRHIGFMLHCCYGNLTAGCINRYNRVAR